MQGAELQKRHKQFAIRIIKMVDAMPHTISAMAIARQIVRSGTSPSANYRAACIAKSEKDFINKLKMVEEELDETLHWLTLIEECEMLPSERMQDIISECTELLKITISSIVSTRKSINEPKETK
ncbi:MAG: four helix bundle protein [Paludibacteraceae bacterium]|nr:four helix bundle protein [Paludibacteraceae bacterium]MBR1473352.1 four helix bundle protein [Paludibacteraceae bacterium]